MESKWWIPGFLQQLENNEYVNERRRDVIRKSCKGVDYVVYGIENQSTVDEHMPIRVLAYDSIHYNKEADRHKGKVHPVITVIFYTGEKEWDTSLRLKDCIDYPEELEPFIPEFTAYLINIKDDIQFKTKALQDLFDIIKCIYMKQPFTERFNSIEAKIVRLAGTLTRTKDLEEYKGEGEINMCRAWDERIQEAKQKLEQEVRQEIKQEVRQEIKQEVIEQD